MTHDEIEGLILGVKRWQRGDERAPNKPLLMAYILANYINGQGQMFSFSEIEKDIENLLKRFGPSRRSYHPEYPFWRLKNDGIWRLDNAEECLSRRSNTDAKKSELIEYEVKGGFCDGIYNRLKEAPQLATKLLEKLLNENFPDSIIPEILSQLGIVTWEKAQRRDPNFRREVLNAYNAKCSICGFDARLNDELFALEAAHIKWKQFNGPCEVNNGLAMCSIHHKALDKGALSVTTEMTVKISDMVICSGMAEAFLWKYDGKEISIPRQTGKQPLPKYFEWHLANVFRSTER
ncbi:phosphorothioated DNA-binding restriction endonuclease [Alteromonas sp. W364]|uniref:phosphorothioated DNA-binding restriction endonuclease n=1 Tax=Alteromonas sp. W364 TaxID=3075610 RepID=UPI002888790C|nr:HNH endonuclease [Alteromonas sp. W364]MDT0628076.1 HNH endonuclease [Alteromonas sp. W364]